ncbi:unnamed protein product [Prorocentrum cordatum]|uniref:ABC transmembrane type-1 domain-containing protein n=1 Tax=Prorocentrum cordatum TaxID=2364126 RepID=A0ABN9QU23_9DINO|nr:unnamed protein product [Polarella glacialis]
MAALVGWLRGVVGREWWTRALPAERGVCRIADDDVDHERVLLHYVAEGERVILSPEGGIYAEDMRCGNAETGPARSFLLVLQMSRMRRLYRVEEALGPEKRADALTRGRQAALDVEAALPEPREAGAVSGQRVSRQEAAGKLLAAERGCLLRLGVAVALLGGTLLEAPAVGHAWVGRSGGPGVAIGAEVGVTKTEGLSFEDGPEPFGVLRAADGGTGRFGRLDAGWVPGRLAEESAFWHDLGRSQARAMGPGRRRAAAAAPLEDEEPAEPLGGTATPGLAPPPLAEPLGEQRDALARTLGGVCDEQGGRIRRWWDVVGESRQGRRPGAQVGGPPGALHKCKYMGRHGGDPRLWADLAIRVRGLGQNDCVVHKLRTIVEALYQGLLCDQLNMSGLMMVEEMTRRVTAMVEAYADPPKPSWRKARIFADASSDKDVSGPELRGYIHRRAKKPHEVEQAQSRARTLRGAPTGTVGGAEARSFLPLPLLGDAGRRIRGRSTASSMPLTGCRGNSLHGPANDMQRDVLARFEGLVRGRQPDAKLQEPQAALRELLRGRSPYDGRSGPTTVASYSAGLVSMPTDVSDCPRLEDILPGEALTFLQERQERMLRESPLPTDVEPYFDSVLKFNHKEYRGLVRRLLSAGILGWTLTPKERIGMFFVWKDGRRRLRLIVDARRANAHFRDPPGVELLSSEGLARIEVHMPDTGFSSYEDLRAALEAQQVYIGMADVKDCFHRMRIDSALSQYFCLPPVKAGAFGVTEVEGAKVQTSTAIYPCWQVLPMGFSWSLYFAQRANEEVSRRSSALLWGPSLSDHGPPLVLAPGRAPQEVRHYVYVDNLGVFSLFSELVSGVMNQLTGEFTELNLLLHKDELVPGKAVRGLLARRRVKGWAVEAVLGHLTFCGLCSRGTLSAFNSVYGFVRAHYDEAAVLWAEARRELAAFSSLMYFLESDWWLPWNPLVQQSDASLHGYGLARAFWPRELVESVGRVPERARFRRRCAHSAREAALCAAGFSMSESGKWILKGLPEEEEELGQWDVARDFPEVPAQGLRAGLWEPCFARAWQHPEGILTLEARALVSSIHRNATTVFGSHIRQLLLCDNMSVVLSFNRGPSAHGQEARCTRQLAPAPPVAPQPPPAARREHQLCESELLKTAVLSRPLPRSPGQMAEDLGKVPVPAEPAQGARESVGPCDSGSSGPEVATGAARQRRLAQSQERLAHHYGMTTGEEGFSYLERGAVRTPSLREYQRAWDGWRDFARRSWPPVSIGEVIKSRDDSMVASALVSYLTGLHQAGTHLSWAEKLMAGVLHFNPDMSSYGARRLPQGWSFWTLRLPPEEEGLREKAGLVDVSLELDSPWIRFLDPVLRQMKKEKHPEYLWNFTCPEYCKMFSLRLQDLPVRAKLVPYQIRLSGASVYMARRWRRLADVQKRRQWKANRSVVRYEKHARLAATWTTRSCAQQNVFLVCGAQLADIILDRASPVDLRELDHVRVALKPHCVPRVVISPAWLIWRDGACACEDRVCVWEELGRLRLFLAMFWIGYPKFVGRCFARIFFTWVFPLLQRCAGTEQLSPDDLFHVRETDKPEAVFNTFFAAWLRQLAHSRGRRAREGRSLLKTLLRVHLPHMRLLWLGRIVQDPDATVWQGLGMAAGLLGAQALSVALDQNVSIGMQTVGLRIRSSLTTAIFRKVLLLRQDSLTSFSTGRLNNMITTDVDKARRVVRFIHILLLTAPARIAISIVALYKLVGVSVFISFGWMGVVILLNPAIMYVANKLEDRQQSMTDERVRKATEVISAIQVVKCYAWEEPATSRVEAARKAELLAMWRLYCLYTVMEGLWSSIVPVTTAVMFAAYSLLNPGHGAAFVPQGVVGLPQGLRGVRAGHARSELLRAGDV